MEKIDLLKMGVGDSLSIGFVPTSQWLRDYFRVTGDGWGRDRLDRGSLEVAPQAAFTLSFGQLLRGTVLPDNTLHTEQTLLMNGALLLDQQVRGDVVCISNKQSRSGTLIDLKTRLWPEGSDASSPVITGVTKLLVLSEAMLSRTSSLRKTSVSAYGQMWLARMVRQRIIDAYASVSGDHNPIHVNLTFALEKLGGTIAHGMWTMSGISALLSHFVEAWLTQGTLEVKFTLPARPGDEVMTGLVPIENESGKYLVEARNQKSEVLISGSAGVRVGPNLEPARGE